MEHSFNVQFAQKYGIEESIIVHNFYFWLRKNIANEKHLHNGRYWTYNSNNAFTQLFPYINKTKIFRVLKHLEECDIILKDNFNTSVWDKTLWYSFSDNGLCELHAFGYDVTDFGKMNHRDNQSEPTIPDNKLTDSKQEEKEDNKLSSQKKENDELFCQFESFAKEYKNLCGKHTVSGIKTLFNDFVKRHKDWETVIPLLMPALHLEDQARKNAAARKDFYPMPKNLSTYLGKQRAWEVWTEYIGKRMTDEYTPQCDGISLFWNELQQCYITPFDVESVTDGYTKDNRPNNAVVMWRGYKYTWNSNVKQWVKQQ